MCTSLFKATSFHLQKYLLIMCTMVPLHQAIFSHNLILITDYYEFFFFKNFLRECPEECREAVSSLNYAAARFADLPELRDLRSIFTERYGNSLDSYTSKEVTIFVYA